MINERVLTKSLSNEARTFFVKMVGDFYRYSCEIAEAGQPLQAMKAAALKAYNEANEIPLLPYNPTKLGTVLNFSVFYYDVMKDHKRALELVEESLNEETLENMIYLTEEDLIHTQEII
jgi:14-3-3 protein epsilon